MSIQEAFKNIIPELRKVSEEPCLEAEVLLSFVLKKSKEFLATYPETELKKKEIIQLKLLLKQRVKNNTPLPYLTKQKEFCGLEFQLNKTVLIPRPETELLVEEAIRIIKEKIIKEDIKIIKTKKGKKENKIKKRKELIKTKKNLKKLQVLEIGTGSGCIAISLLKLLSKERLLTKKDSVDNSSKNNINILNRINLIATDISAKALKIARINAKKHKVFSKIKFIQSNLLDNNSFKNKRNKFDIIIANLPYVPSKEAKLIAHSPILALDGGIKGVRLTGELIKQSKEYLKEKGVILLEIDCRQGKKIKKITKGVFQGAEIEIFSDLTGLDRVVRIRTKNQVNI